MLAQCPHILLADRSADAELEEHCAPWMRSV